MGACSDMPVDLFQQASKEGGAPREQLSHLLVSDGPYRSPVGVAEKIQVAGGRGDGKGSGLCRRGTDAELDAHGCPKSRGGLYRNT
jgi:hypothetical protein